MDERKIESEPSLTLDKIEKKKKGNLLKRAALFLLKTFLFIILAVMLISSTVLFLSQFYGFRHWALKTGLGFVNKGLTGRIELDDIQFAGLQGIKLYGLRVLASGDTVANVKRATIDVLYEPLLVGRVILNNVTLEDYTLKLLRSRDSTWNVNHISPPSTTPSKPSKWIIDARKVSLVRGRVLLVDSLKDLTPTYRINYSHMDLNELNINLSAKIDLGRKSYYADIKNLNAKEKVSGFNLKKFSVQATINNKYLEARKLNLQTDSTDMWMYAKMGRFNLFGDSTEMDLTKSYFWATVNAKSISQSDIKRFANAPFRVQGTPSLELVADGTLDDMNIKKFEAVYSKTNVNLTGRLLDVMGPNMKYEADLSGSYLVKSDFVIMLPTFDFGKLPSFGEAKLDVMRLKGDLRGASAEMDVKTAAGDIRGKASAGFGKEVMDYFADLSVRKLDLSKILNNPSMASDLNAEINASGRGTDLKNMSAKISALASRSSAYGYTLDQLKLDATVAPGGVIALDTLYALMPKVIRYEKTDVFNENYSKLRASGIVNLSDMKSPFYELNVDFTGLDLTHIAKTASLPEHVSGGLTIRGKGIELDSILADAQIRITEALFEDRALFPFSVDAHIFRTADGKTVQLNSDYFNATLSGKYKISDITETFALQADYLIKLLNDRIGEIFPKDRSQDTLRFVSTEIKPAAGIKLPRSLFDASLNVELIDVAPLGAFMPDKQLSAKANLALKMISDSSHTRLTIDSINVKEVYYRDSGMYFRAQPLFISGDMRLDLNDTMPEFKYLEMSVIETGDIDFNGTIFTKPRIYGKLADNKAVFKIRSSVNNDIFAGLGGTVTLDRPRMKVTIDSAAINYQERFLWKTDEPIIADITQNSVTIQSAKFSRANAERIQITGALENGEARNVVARIENFQLHDIVQIMPAEDQDKLNSFYGMIDSIVVTANGKLTAPEVSAQARMTKIQYAKMKIGNFDLDALYKNSIAMGGARLYVPRDSVRDSLTLLNVDIRSFPVAMGGDSTKKSKEPINVALIANKIPLELISPFVPTVSSLSGRADAQFALTGTLPKDINYEGYVNLIGSYFVLQPTNIGYYANGSITINKEKIDIKNLTLNNTSDDSPGGKADIKGSISMKDMAISDIDITASLNRFLVLSDASEETMPNLYGTFIMSTGARPIRFNGSLKEPNLSGDLVINEGNLRMPPGRSTTTVTRTSFEYYIKGDNREFVFYNYPDTAKVRVDTTSRNVKQQDETFRDENISMMEMMNLDIAAQIEGNFQVVIELGTIGDVYAKIGTNDPSVPIRYVKKRYNPNANLYGELQVKEGSMFKTFRMMNTEGSISFPSGDITNPNLNLLAEYNGSQTEGASVRRYKVKIYITGTKEVPIMRFGYEIDGQEATGDESKINEDALMLLLTGRTKGAAPSAFGSNQLNEVASSGFTNVASSTLTDIFLRTGVIQSVDLDFQGRSTSLDNANLNITGTYGNVTWRIGGSLTDFYSSNRIVVDVPFSVEAGFLNNIILQTTYSLNPNVQTTYDDPKIWEVKLRLGGSW